MQVQAVLVTNLVRSLGRGLLLLSASASLAAIVTLAVRADAARPPPPRKPPVRLCA